MIHTEQVTRLTPVTKEESIEVPEGLVKLVNSNDEEWGRNGYKWMGCERKRQGGHTIDRLRHYIQNHQTYHIEHRHPCDCPIKLS